jgi:LysM repeat protein
MTMYIKNRLRHAVAAAAVTTSVAVALVAAGAVRADTSFTPDQGSTSGAGSSADSPPGPGRGLDGGWYPHQKVTVVGEYEVAKGDSYWAIAGQQLPDGATAREVWTLTQALMAYNAPRLGYDVAAMLKPGDVVDVVAASSAPEPASSAPAAHQVVAGDSYWAIAESMLGDDATGAEVMAKTESLIALNSPRLGYENPQMLHPGDVVYLEEVATTTNAPSNVAAEDHDAGTSDVPAPVQASTESPEPEPTPTATGPSSTAPATSHLKPRRQTPTSPPLSEIALIASRTSTPATSATSRQSVDKPARTPRSVVAAGAPAATMAHVSAS